MKARVRVWMKAAEQGDESAIGLQQLDEIEGRTTPSFTPKPFECATCYRPHDPSEHKLRHAKDVKVEHWKREIN